MTLLLLLMILLLLSGGLCKQGQAGRWIRHQENAEPPAALLAKISEDDKEKDKQSWPRSRKRASNSATGVGQSDGADNTLRVFKHATPNLRQRLEQAITLGHTVLIEGVGEVLDNWLDPILTKQVLRFLQLLRRCCCRACRGRRCLVDWLP